MLTFFFLYTLSLYFKTNKEGKVIKISLLMTSQVKSMHPRLEPYNLFTVTCDMKASTEHQVQVEKS